MLSMLPDRDASLRHYLGCWELWSTVTPVVLPGRFTRTAGRVRRLLRQAFKHAGWPAELVERAELEWRDVGFRAGVDRAQRYRLPEQLRERVSYHVQVRWPTAVRGPLVIGAGRYRGLGLFAGEAASLA